MVDDWKKPYEDDGVTLGPEDALNLEIQKSKALKVEKLQLGDALEKLKAENYVLLKTNQSLKQKLESFPNQPAQSGNSLTEHYFKAGQKDRVNYMRWAFFLVSSNLIALGILLIFFLK